MLLEALYRRMSIREGHVTFTKQRPQWRYRMGLAVPIGHVYLCTIEVMEAESRRNAQRVWQFIYNRRIATWARRDKTTETSKSSRQLLDGTDQSSTLSELGMSQELAFVPVNEMNSLLQQTPPSH